MENKFKEKVMKLYKDKRGIEDSFKFLIFTFVLASLFAMILFTVIINQGTAYSKDSNEVLHGMNVQGINATVSGFEAQAQALQSSLNTNSSGIFNQAFGVIGAGLGSIGFIASSLFTMIISPFEFLGGIMGNILGVPAWIIFVIEAMVILAGIFGIIRLLKWGS